MKNTEGAKFQPCMGNNNTRLKKKNYIYFPKKLFSGGHIFANVHKFETFPNSHDYIFMYQKGNQKVLFWTDWKDCSGIVKKMYKTVNMIVDVFT